MGQRYVLPEQVDAEREFLPTKVWWRFAAKFNVAPSEYLPAIRWQDGQSEASMLRWGFIPASAEGRLLESPTASTAIYQLLEKPSYREAWLNSQRCIVPLAGYYGWALTAAKHRQPYFFSLIHRAVFGVAGIWDRTVKDEDDVLETCSVLRVSANQMTSQTTGERRMPAILRRKDYQTWLRGTPAEAIALLHPYKSEWMHAHPVSPRVNSLAQDDAALTYPAAVL